MKFLNPDVFYDLYTSMDPDLLRIIRELAAGSMELDE